MTYADLFSVRDKVILFTGGTGHLGRGIASALAELGARVWVVGRDAQKFHAFDEIKRKGAVITCRQVSAVDVPSMTAVVQEMLDRYNRIDALVNGAAHQARRGIDLNLPPGEIADGLRSCFTHYLTNSQIVIPHMRKQKAGAILNIASLWAEQAPDPAMYLDLNNEPAVYLPPAKAAILGLTRMLASYCAKDGIRVNAISPGLFPCKRGPDRPDYMAEMERRIPMNRIGQPSELVGAVVYLLSNASSYVTGQNLVVDGGYSVW